MSVDDRLAILEQIGRYSYAWDGRDTDAYAALFTADGVFEVFAGGEQPVIHNAGRDAIHAWARAIHTGEDPGRRPRQPGEQSRHNQSSTVFAELGPDSRPDPHDAALDGAGSRRPGAPAPSTTGVYNDDWRRTPEGWRLARRSLRMDTPPKA